MLTIPHNVLAHYKGDKDMDKVLELEEAQGLMDDLISNAQKNRGFEVNGSIAYTA